jgi:dTDP-glucose 4,6-dehydratase
MLTRISGKQWLRSGGKMKFLITGGAGFIGSNFTRMLLTNHFGELLPIEKVTVLDKLTYAGNFSNLESISTDSRFRFVEGDICDSRLVDQLTQECDIIVNFAAESHVDRSIESSSDFIETNVKGVGNLLEYAVSNNVKTFVQISTDEVYGSIANGSWTEQSPVLPNSPYAASKAAADLLVMAFSKTHGLDTRITRCCNNYGPYQYPEKIIPLFISRLINGKKIPIYGSGSNIREWIHVDDHCAAIGLTIAKGKPGDVYNIAGNCEMSNLDLSRILLEEFNQGESAIEYVQDRKGHDLRYSLDGRFARDVLGFHPQVEFTAGIHETIAWYRKNPSWIKN